MGALFSSPKHIEPVNLLFPRGRHYPYHGNPAPEEASRAEEDSKTYYADFYEKACCVPHQDGRQVIVYWIPDKFENPRETPAWAVKRLKKLYERLSSDHPRVVRHNGTIDGAIDGQYGEKIGGLLLEKLTPGPMCLLDIPALRVPKAATSDAKDVLVLALYYRWALQALSAMSFFHNRGIFLRVFTSQMVWLRSDFSLAIAGFINAVTTDDYPYTKSTIAHRRNETSRAYYEELPREDDGMVTDESLRYEENGEEVPGVKEDLFEWATFVWRLMLSDEDTGLVWPNNSTCPRSDIPIADYGQNRDTLEAALWQRAADDLEWQQLEGARLGRVLAKAWNGGYESARDVMKDIAATAETIGIRVTEDEVDVGGAWEDIFEVVEGKFGFCDRQLRFNTLATERLDPWPFV